MVEKFLKKRAQVSRKLPYPRKYYLEAYAQPVLNLSIHKVYHLIKFRSILLIIGRNLQK